MSQASKFRHAVYFWLREGGTSADAEKLAQGCRDYLTRVPGVLSLEVGFPAGTARKVVDNTYGVALLIEFADAAAHDVYQAHPDHLKFIEMCSSLWSRVQIYDSLMQ